MKTIRFILAVTFLLTFQYGVANAAISFVDSDGTGAVVPSITQLGVGATTGEEGEFELLSCATQSDGSNFFTNAEPNWDNFDIGGCGGAPNCIMGIFTKLAPEPNNIQSTCFWNDPTNAATGIVMRYSGVNSNLPVADFECNTGIGNVATAPEVNAPEGSFIIRIYGANGNFLDAANLPGSKEFGRSFGGGSQSSLFVYGEPFPDGGVADEVSISYQLVDTAWRACAASLRMDGVSPIRPIPTLSEWGFLAFAVLAGAFGLWFIRRRSVTA